MSNITSRQARHWLVAATMLSGVAIPSLALAQAGAEWTTQGGDPQGTRYSSLDQINAGNVGKLVEDFKVPTNAIQNHEGSPLVVNNRMYVVTPWPDNLIAIDLAQKGKVLWTYQPKTDPGARAQACCDVDNRGAAYADSSQGAGADGLLIYNTLDGHIIGVNAVTGKLVWNTELLDFRGGATLTGAPIIADGIAMVGNSGAENGVRGAVYGVRVKDGTLAWKAYNTGPDSDVRIGRSFHAFYPKDRGDNLGLTSWNGQNWWQHGGATAWGYKTYDPQQDLFFYGTGNADPWSPVMRGGQGDAKWAATIFARKPQTGEAVWAYQLTPDDSWDFDAIEESIVADIPINGRTRHVLFHVDKNGFGYTLDALTGQVLVVGDVSAAMGALTNWATGVDLATGLPHVVLSHYFTGLGPGGGVRFNCPSPSGIKDEEPVAFSFQTQLFYVPAHNGCLGAIDVEQLYIPGSPLLGIAGFPKDRFQNPGPAGALVAWDAGTGKAAWVDKEKYQLWSGVLATAGDLVFYGTLSNGTDTPSSPTVKAVDARTGKLLWSAALECPSVGNPMSFLGPDGKQRIAIFTGVGGEGALGTGKCPHVAQYQPDPNKPDVWALKEDDAKYVTWLHRTYKVPATAFASQVTTGYVHVFKLP